MKNKDSSHFKIILASASPRRARLLRQMGLNIHVVPSKIKEKIPKGLPPKRLVERLALLKAKEVAGRIKKTYLYKQDNLLVIGADTIVVLKGKILGKPNSVAQGKKMLRLLSNTTHYVITGIATVEARSGKAFVDS